MQLNLCCDTPSWQTPPPPTRRGTNSHLKSSKNSNLTNNLVTPEEINKDIRQLLGRSSTVCMVYRLYGFNQPTLQHKSLWITIGYSHTNVQQNLWNGLWDKSNYSLPWTMLLRINSWIFEFSDNFWRIFAILNFSQLCLLHINWMSVNPYPANVENMVSS